jgi:hypothetical protein
MYNTSSQAYSETVWEIIFLKVVVIVFIVSIVAHLVPKKIALVVALLPVVMLISILGSWYVSERIAANNLREYLKNEENTYFTSPEFKMNFEERQKKIKSISRDYSYSVSDNYTNILSVDKESNEIIFLSIQSGENDFYGFYESVDRVNPYGKIVEGKIKTFDSSSEENRNFYREFKNKEGKTIDEDYEIVYTEKQEESEYNLLKYKELEIPSRDLYLLES